MAGSGKCTTLYHRICLVRSPIMFVSINVQINNVSVLILEHNSVPLFNLDHIITFFYINVEKMSKLEVLGSKKFHYLLLGE